MSFGLVLAILLLIFLVGGLSGHFGGYDADDVQIIGP